MARSVRRDSPALQRIDNCSRLPGIRPQRGCPFKKRFYTDAFAAFELAGELHPGKKIVVFGRSMGGAVAAQLSIMMSPVPAGLILESTLSSVLDVAHDQTPWTRYFPMGLLMKSRFDATGHVSKSSTPKLIFHGGSDRTLSHINSERIFAAAMPPKRIHVIPGSDHDGLDLVDPDLYHGFLREFLAEFNAL